jgi:hypothetical protein
MKALSLVDHNLGMPLIIFDVLNSTRLPVSLSDWISATQTILRDALMCRQILQVCSKTYGDSELVCRGQKSLRTTGLDTNSIF